MVQKVRTPKKTNKPKQLQEFFGDTEGKKMKCIPKYGWYFSDISQLGYNELWFLFYCQTDTLFWRQTSKVHAGLFSWRWHSDSLTGSQMNVLWLCANQVFTLAVSSAFTLLPFNRTILKGLDTSHTHVCTCCRGRKVRAEQIVVQRERNIL